MRKALVAFHTFELKAILRHDFVATGTLYKMPSSNTIQRETMKREKSFNLFVETSFHHFSGFVQGNQL
jgi:hypothetical protein